MVAELKEKDYRLEWPDAEVWVNSPEAIAEDMEELRGMFNSLVETSDIEIGPFFSPKDDASWILWFATAPTFIDRLRAAKAVVDLPVSAKQIGHVLELTRAWDAVDSIHSRTRNLDGSPRCTYRDRYSFEQRLQLCREASQIMYHETSCALEFARLRQAETARSTSPTHGIPAGDRADTANEVAFYAKYPAELADEIAADFEQYLKHDIPPRNNLRLTTVSPLVESEDYWRIFKSLLPSCPIEIEPFQELRSAVLQEAGEPYRSSLEKVGVQIRRLGLWLEATGLWSQRPPDANPEPRAEQSGSLWQATPKFFEDINRGDDLDVSNLLQKLAWDIEASWRETPAKTLDELISATTLWRNVLRREKMGDDPLDVQGKATILVDVLRMALLRWSYSGSFKYNVDVFDALKNELEVPLYGKELGPTDDPFFEYTLDAVESETFRLRQWLTDNDHYQGHAPGKPSWNGVTATLSIGVYERSFGGQAHAVKAFLQLFEDHDWQSHVPVPAREYRAIRTLREDKRLPISFHQRGKNVEWKWKKSETTDEVPMNCE